MTGVFQYYKCFRRRRNSYDFGDPRLRQYSSPSTHSLPTNTSNNNNYDPGRRTKPKSRLHGKKKHNYFSTNKSYKSPV